MPQKDFQGSKIHNLFRNFVLGTEIISIFKYQRWKYDAQNQQRRIRMEIFHYKQKKAFISEGEKKSSHKKLTKLFVNVKLTRILLNW